MSRIPTLVRPILVLLVLLAWVSPLSAGYDVWTDTTVAPGVTWRNKVYPSLFGGKQTVNVLEVDLTAPGVSVRPVKAGTCTATSTMASGAGAVAAINGGFFGSCASVSMIKINDQVLDTNPGWKPARATIGIDRAAKAAAIARIASTDSWPAVDDALGGGPNLRTNGVNDVTWSQEGFDSSYLAKNPRTATGITSTGKLLLVTVDGRTSAGVGMTLDELATYMGWLGAVNAMNLDGGGSTTMWTEDDGVVNTVSDGTERGVVSILAVFSTPPAPVEVVVDNDSSGWTASSNWWASSSTPGYVGTNYRVRATASASDAATWKATLATSGNYQVFVRYTSGSNRASAAPYIVYHTGGSTTVAVNQRVNGGQWVSIGTFNMAAGTSTRVALSCWTSSGTYVIGDAVRLVKQ